MALLALTGGLFGQAVTREGNNWTQTVADSMPAGRATKIYVFTEGRVKLRGEAASEVSYTLKKRRRGGSEAQASALFDKVTVRQSNEGGALKLIVDRPRFDFNNLWMEIDVKVPRGVELVGINTKGGDVTATDLDGSVESFSGGGQADVDRIGRDVQLKTGGGNIRAGRVQGALHAWSGGGNIRIDSAGEMELNTGGGEIFVREARGRVQAKTGGGNIHIDRATHGVFANTGGGIIEVVESGGVVTAGTGGGSIQIGAAKGASCDSGAGAIRLRNVSGSLRASTGAGMILADLSSEPLSGESVLTTRHGDIVVMIPSNLSVTVNAISHPGGGKIVSEFPEFRVRSGEGDGGRPARAEGSLNGGGPKLILTASDGTIYLRRTK